MSLKSLSRLSIKTESVSLLHEKVYNYVIEGVSQSIIYFCLFHKKDCRRKITIEVDLKDFKGHEFFLCFKFYFRNIVNQRYSFLVIYCVKNQSDNFCIVKKYDGIVFYDLFLSLSLSLYLSLFVSLSLSLSIYIYIYIYISGEGSIGNQGMLSIIIIIISCWQHGYPWPSLATPPYRSSP